MTDAAKNKTTFPGLAALRLVLLLVVALCLPETRVWGFAVSPQPASGVFESASPSSVGEITTDSAYDASDSPHAPRATPKLNNAANAVEDFLGGQGKIIKNADGDTILMRGDKKIRFDIKDPHGDKPHFHLEQQTPGGKWKDAGPEHRYYFKEDGQ
jgi:hypothetical protein